MTTALLDNLFKDVLFFALGVFIFGDQDEIFSRRVEKMKSVLTKRLEVYSNEEKTLVVMLEEEQEQMKKEDDRKRKKIMEKGKKIYAKIFLLLVSFSFSGLTSCTYEYSFTSTY